MYSLVKPPNVFRVLLIGPSFAFGWANNYCDSYAAQLQSGLQGSPVLAGRTVEVINAGVPAQQPFAQKKWYEQVGLAYDPDVTVFFRYGSMVLYNEPDKETVYSVTDDGYLVKPDTAFVRLRMTAKRSAIVFYGYTLCRRVAEIASERESGPRTNSAEAFNPEYKMVYLTLRELAEFHDLAATTGGTLIVVRAPMGYEVYRETKKRWDNMRHRDPKDVVEYNSSACRYLARELAIPCLNLTPVMLAESQESSEPLYYLIDGHWTPKGNRIAATATAQTIIEQVELDSAAGKSLNGESEL